MAVILAAIFSIGCERPGATDEIPDETPRDTELYVIDPAGGWTDPRDINVGGNVYPLTILNDSTARTTVGAGDAPLFMAVPSDAVFDAGSGSYTLTLKGSQDYLSPQETFIGSACSYGSGAFPFRTATINGIAGHVTIGLHTTGIARPSWASITPADGEMPCAGVLRQDCVSGSWSILEGERSVRLALPSRDMPTIAEDADILSFAVLPGTYPGGFVIDLEGGRQIRVEQDITVKSARTVDLGTFCIEPDSGLTQLGIRNGAVLGSPSWEAGTRLSVNGCRSEADGAADGVLTVPFSAAASYSVVYPVAEGYTEDGRYLMHIPTSQKYAEKAPASDPILYGSGTGTADITLSQASGVIRLKIYTAPGPTRLLKSVRLTGDGVAAEFTIDPETGEIVRTGSCSEGITVSFGDAHLKESNDAAAPTSFSFVVLPGSYKGLKLEVTARDATCKVPDGLLEDDLWTVTTYDVPDASVTAGASTILTLEPLVESYDWIRQNGVCYTGSKEISQCTAAFIDTGWLVPSGSGHSVSYQCTMSGSLPRNVSDRRQERVLFGSQGSGSDKPVFFVFNENASARAWYATMACVAGRETYKQETASQKYSMSADLDGLRTIRISTEGIKNSSYIHMQIRRDDMGSQVWTDLHPDTDYFKFKSGSLSCSYPLYLFCKNYSGKIGSPCPHIRIHRFVISYDGKIERDLTPCTVDGIPGMVDNAHPGTYYFNPNPNVETVTKNGCLTAFEVGLNSDIR